MWMSHSQFNTLNSIGSHQGEEDLSLMSSLVKLEGSGQTQGLDQTTILIHKVQQLPNKMTIPKLSVLRGANIECQKKLEAFIKFISCYGEITSDILEVVYKDSDTQDNIRMELYSVKVRLSRVPFQLANGQACQVLQQRHPKRECSKNSALKALDLKQGFQEMSTSQISKTKPKESNKNQQNCRHEQIQICCLKLVNSISA
jgi:hypothetical protein